MRTTYRPVEWHWRRMPTATLGGGAGITPTQNTWYTVLDTMKNTKIKNWYFIQTNDEAAGKNIELKLTTNTATLIDATGTFNSGQTRYVYVYSTVELATNTALFSFGRYVDYTCKSAKLEIRMTSAPSASTVLKSSVQYEQYVRI